MDTVLVTGGCGFLGSHIIDAFAAEERFIVIGVSRNPSKSQNPKASYIACDIEDHAAIAAIVEQTKPSAIVHCAWPSPFAPTHAQKKALQATSRLIKIAQNAPTVKAFIATGSAEAVSNSSGHRAEPLSESEATFYGLDYGHWPYQKMKGASCTLLIAANSRPAPGDEDLRGHILTTVLHLPGIYGPRDPTASPTFIGMANTISTRFQLGNNIPVHEWVYVESAAQAHVLAAKALLGDIPKAEHKVDGEAFFITDGEPVRLWDYMRKFWAAAGDNESRDLGRVYTIPWWVVTILATISEVLFAIFGMGLKEPAFSRHHINYMKEGARFDITKARERLGYKPLVTTDRGIQKTVEWFKQPQVRERPTGQQM